MITNTKAIAHAVAVYGESFKSLNQRNNEKREMFKRNVSQRKRVGNKWLI